MTNTGKKLNQSRHAETSSVEAAKGGDLILTKIEKTEIVFEIAPTEKRDFTIIFSRLKKSARKKSVSIF